MHERWGCRTRWKEWMVEIVSVLTTESVGTVLANGGTQPWALSKSRATACEFVVLCRNARKSRHATDPHGSPFMVGRIRDVVPSPQSPGRWLIRISEYAEVVWLQQSFARKPILYRTAGDYGSDDGGSLFDTLDFKPVSLAAAAPVETAGAAFQLTIAGAKAWLAASLCLPESAIEITIRA